MMFVCAIVAAMVMFGMANPAITMAEMTRKDIEALTYTMGVYANVINKR